MNASRIALLGLLLGAGCAHAPQPFTFTTTAPAPTAIDRVAASLAREGHAVSAVDRRAATVTTYWQDTGYRYRETADLENETNIFLRLHVAVRPTAAGSEVTISAESQRCVSSGAVVTRDAVISTCVKMNRLVTRHQRSLDDLGRKLSASVAGG
jgi:hypothetical protein